MSRVYLPRQIRHPREVVSGLEDERLKVIFTHIFNILDKLNTAAYDAIETVMGDTPLTRAQITAVGTSTFTATLLGVKGTPSKTINVRHIGSNALSGNYVWPKMAADDIIDVYRADDKNWYWVHVVQDHPFSQVA